VSVEAYIRNAMRRHGSRIALVDGERRWTFAELNGTVERVAGGLQSRLLPGARVGLYMQNRAEYLILQLALEYAGLVRVPLNMRYTAYEAKRVIEDCGASMVLCDSSTAGRLDDLEDGRLWVCTIGGAAKGGPSWSELVHFEGVAAKGTEDFDALCSINYTSGSSGVPKGVLLTHRNWHSVYKNMLVDRDIRSDDKLGHIGPLTHASGAYFTPFLLRGATNVIVSGNSLESLLQTIEHEKITAFSCVPTVLTRILNSDAIDRYDLSSVRWIGYGGESIQRNTLQKALARWGPVLTHNYGLTEAMMTCSFLTAAGHTRIMEDGTEQVRYGCIGQPYTFVDVVLRREDGTEVAIGEIGEITIRAEHVMQGYWNRPDETAKVLRDGWLWSGDLARRDENGYIYIVGRSKEMLISGGFNIYPGEVEACLSNCPGVQEVAVIGIPDEAFGQVCIAFVVPECGTSLAAEECIAYCKPKIGIRTPKKWVFVEQLPRTANGKVDKAKLEAGLMQTAPCSE
jgi:acyl-CoA synthetase (AMP-forming)/AMP-acid ligase II